VQLKTEVLVLGDGPDGYAADLGKQVALVFSAKMIEDTITHLFFKKR
jgi:hypothetical protein